MNFSFCVLVGDNFSISIVLGSPQINLIYSAYDAILMRSQLPRNLFKNYEIFKELHGPGQTFQ